MFGWTRKPAAQPQPQPGPKRGSFWASTHADDGMQAIGTSDKIRAIMRNLPRPKIVGAQDDSGLASTSATSTAQGIGALPDQLTLWYVNQGFIGHQLAAIVAQHWLVNKACTMPGRDAIRQGFDTVAVDGDKLAPEALKILNRCDRAMRLSWNLEQFVRMGRVFGVRIALFRVQSTDPEYYAKPFNPDGVGPGCYKGITQVDPYWTAPLLDQASASDPNSGHFYEPTWWTIQGKRYHRSHLIIYRHAEPADILKPSYLYGGIPLPQMILERVYAAERTANEAPMLAQTKRTTVWLTDMSAFAAQANASEARLNQWAQYRDNFAVKLGDKEGDEIQQFDLSLADLDTVIMTQYQLVAAIANVPATKLLGTTPKGFNATGAYEESSYHEELESIQTHDLTPLIERHHLLCMRSYVAPKLGGSPVETTVEWRPLDSPTAQELAAENLTKAQTGSALVASGAIDGQDERNRIATDPSSGYHGLGAMAPEDLDAEDPEDPNAPPDEDEKGEKPPEKGNGG